MSFDVKSINFSDLPKQNHGNFMTALAEGLNGLGDVELHKEETLKKEKIEADNALFKEAQTKNILGQIDLTQNALADSSSFEKLGQYATFDDFIKENPLKNPANVRSAQEFYEGMQIKTDAEQTQSVLNELRANNGGKLPSEAMLSSMIPQLIEDNKLSNRSAGLVFKVLKEEQMQALDKAYKQSGINLHNAQAQAALLKEPKDVLAKEKSTYLELVKSGSIPPTQGFGEWLYETGGKVNFKSESTTAAQNLMRDQLSGISNIVNSRIPGYNPSKHGIIDGFAQAIQQGVPFLKTGSSAELQSQQQGFINNVAKGLYGGKMTNEQLKRAEDIAGGTVNTEGGAAAQIKSSLEQTILAAEETLGQLKRSGSDVKELEAELNKYKTVRDNLQDWDGSTTTEKYLDPNYKPKGQAPASVVSLRGAPPLPYTTPSTETSTTPTLVQKPSLAQFKSEDELLGAIMQKGYTKDEALSILSQQRR